MRQLVWSIIVLAGFTAPAWAQTNKAVEIVPEDAVGFLVIKDHHQLRDKANDLAAKLNAKDHLAMWDGILGKEVKKQIAEHGSVVVIIMPGKDDQIFPCPVLALPGSGPGLLQALGVKDEAKDGISTGEIEMPGIFGRFGVQPKDPPKGEKIAAGKMPVLVAKRDGFTLVTSIESRDQLQRVLAAKKSIAGKVESAKAWLDEQDFCGAFMPSAVKMGLPFKAKGPADQPLIKDFDKNVNFIACGGRIEKEGNVRLQTRIFFTQQSPYAKRAGKAEAVQTTLLASLPQERYLVAGTVRISPEANFENLLAAHPHPKIPEAKAKELTEAGARLLRRVTEAAWCVHAEAKEEKSGPAVVVFLKVDDSAAFVEGAADLAKKHCDAVTATGDADREAKFDRTRIADKQSVLITITEKKAVKSDKNGGPHGPEATIMTVIDPQTVLIGTLKKADQAESFVKAHATKPARSLEADGELKKALGLLPTPTQLVTFINLKNILHDAKVRDCPPLGVSVSMLPAVIEVQVVAPIETLQALVEAANARDKRDSK